MIVDATKDQEPGHAPRGFFGALDATVCAHPLLSGIGLVPGVSLATHRLAEMCFSTPPALGLAAGAAAAIVTVIVGAKSDQEEVAFARACPSLSKKKGREFGVYPFELAFLTAAGMAFFGSAAALGYAAASVVNPSWVSEPIVARAEIESCFKKAAIGATCRFTNGDVYTYTRNETKMDIAAAGFFGLDKFDVRTDDAGHPTYVFKKIVEGPVYRYNYILNGHTLIGQAEIVLSQEKGLPLRADGQMILPPKLNQLMIR